MSKHSRVTIEGIDDLDKMLKLLIPREARNVQRRAVVEIAKSMRDEVRERAPRGSYRGAGTLKRAIRSRRSGGRIGTANAAIYVTKGRGAKNDAYYWHFLEFGTIKMRAQPFIGPVLKLWDAKIGRVYRQVFGRQLERELAKRARR